MMATPTTGTRNGMVQIFRALAIIAVVMIHTTPAGNWQVFCRPFINYAVATFLFLSGYLTPIENDNWAAFYKKRILRVLVPYVIWTVLYALVSRRLDLIPFYLLTARAAIPFYFIPVYLQLVLLTPILGKLARSKYWILGWFITPLSVIAFDYYWLLTGQEMTHYGRIMWGDSCLAWFIFYYLGLMLGNRIIVKRYSLKRLMVLYLLAILLEMAEGYWRLKLGQVNCATMIKFSSLLTSTVFVLMVYTILQNDRYAIRNHFLKVLGDYSFGIFLCHIMVMNLMWAFIPGFISVPYPISSFMIVLVSFTCCYLGTKIFGEKASRWLGLR